MAITAIKPTREQDFAEWYQQVIQAAEMAENSPVRGCMVIKPYGYGIWENIQRLFDARIKKHDVQNVYFPLLIPVDFLSKEAEHIEGFAKECAVVTHRRLKKDENGKLVPDGELSEPLVIRPTSEALIGHTVSKWINSYRDLPLKLNQWCNVMRWEMRPRLFLRTSEFLWQEGHTVFETEEQAQDDAKKMHEEYFDFISIDLAMPAIKGEKTEEERFPGAKNTYTIEVMMQDGKALQAGTAHYLGQTFSKAFDIKFLGRDNQEHLAFTSSWGISTRLIGGIIMSHADDDGLILPPAIAPYQVVIIPIIHDESKTIEIKLYCEKIKQQLDKLNIRVYVDNSEIKSSNKIWKWIKKGVPIRLEIGLREVEANCATLIRRDIGKDSKESLAILNLARIADLLKTIAFDMRSKAAAHRDLHIKSVASLAELEGVAITEYKGFMLINKTLSDTSEFEIIAKKHSLSRRCIPQGELQKGSELKVLVAKSY